MTDPDPRQDPQSVFERAFFEDMRLGTPRAARALRFSQLVQSMLWEFLPQQRDCARAIADHLTRLGFEQNFEIISVPPECDALDQLALQRMRLEKAIVRSGGSEQTAWDISHG